MTNLGQFEVPYGLQHLNLTEGFRMQCVDLRICGSVCVEKREEGQEGEGQREREFGDLCV